MPSLALSIVSHGQGELVKELLSDLFSLDFSQFESVQTIVTLNIQEDEGFIVDYLDVVTVHRNVRPLGFGSNHNQAFAASTADYFVVLNPDIRLNDSFAQHIIFAENKNWGCMAPIVLSPDNIIQDSARFYPSLLRIGKRLILNNKNLDYDIQSNDDVFNVDWVAGMFVIFKSNVYRTLQGFDDSYFMYLEDADICKRSNKAGFPVLLNLNFSVVHDAQRNSHKNFCHLKWHLRSMVRFVLGV